MYRNKATSDQRPATRGSRFKTAFFSFTFVLSLVASLLFPVCFSGCGPKFTYPSDTLPKSIEDICDKENHLKVTASVAGKTAAAVVYIENLVDDKGQIPKEVHEKMGQIMQAVTRVSLSTDREIDFCVVVIRDRASHNELIVTRSLDDTKRANSDAIGIEESINRTLFSQSKYQPSSGEDQKFVLKEVKLQNFLAEQIAQRMRFSFSKDTKEDVSTQAFVLVDGLYETSSDGKRFRFALLSLKATDARETMIAALKIMKDVLGGYHFTDFNEIEVLDYLNRQKLTITEKTFSDYLAKKIDEQTMLDRYMTESQSIQEAFKLFGFNLVDASSIDTESPPIAAATP